MSPPLPTPALPILDVERFLYLSRQVIAVGVREELRVYSLVTGPQGQSRAALRAALASLLAKNPDHWRQIAHCFDESLRIEPPKATRWQTFLAPGRRLFARLTPSARTALIMALAILCIAFALRRFWPKPPPPPIVETVETPSLPAPPPPTATVRIVEDKPAGTVEEITQEPAPIPKRPWVILCALTAALIALGLRWLLLPGALRRWQMKTQREAEAALAKEARQRGQILRPSYRVEPILPIARSTAEDCATLLGRLLDKERGVDLDVLKTLDATVRAGGRFTPILLPRRASGEVLLLIDDEGRDHPWLSTIIALIELWRRQGVRIAAYTYGNEFPHFLDAYPRVQHESIELSEVARQHAGAALLIFSRRLSVEGFEAESTWTHELEPFPQRAWLDPDPRSFPELPEARRRNITALANQHLARFPLTDLGVAAAVRQVVREGESASDLDWPQLSPCRTPAEQRALRLWATAAALVPDATWDQVLALRAALPEINDVFPAPDVRPVQRLLEWVKRESREEPEKDIDRLFLPVDFQDRLVRDLRKKDGGPTRKGGFEQRVHQILLGQLGDAPRAAEQQEGRGRLIWDLKVAMHKTLLAPERARDLLARFIGTGVESLLGRFLRGEQERQADHSLFAPNTWANLGALISQEGRVAPRDLLFSNLRLWLLAITPALTLGALFALPVLIKIPKITERLQPKVERITERETPAESHVERIDDTSVRTEALRAAAAVFAMTETPQRPALVWVPPGTFMMGSAADDPNGRPYETRHSVRLTHGYYMMETEVTQGQYQAVMGENPAATRTEADGRECKPAGVGAQLAVYCVDWFDAVKYANVLSTFEGREQCYIVNGKNVSWPKKQACTGYRLPTEAEWEYAARAGKSFEYAGSNSVDEVAWHIYNSEKRVHAVRTKKPNTWGLYDMSGNVQERAWDEFSEGYERLSGTDPIDPGDGRNRVTRGGSIWSAAELVRIASRNLHPSGQRSNDIGFRLARSFP